MLFYQLMPQLTCIILDFFIGHPINPFPTLMRNKIALYQVGVDLDLYISHMCPVRSPKYITAEIYGWSWYNSYSYWAIDCSRDCWGTAAWNKFPSIVQSYIYIVPPNLPPRFRRFLRLPEQAIPGEFISINYLPSPISMTISDAPTYCGLFRAF